MQSKEMYQILNGGKLEYVGKSTDALHSVNCNLGHNVFLPRQ